MKERTFSNILAGLWWATLMAVLAFVSVGCTQLPKYELFDCDDPDNWPPTSADGLKVIKSQDPVPGQYIVEMSSEKISQATRLGSEIFASANAPQLQSTLLRQGQAMGGSNVVALGVINSFAASFDMVAIKGLAKAAAMSGVVAIYEATKVSVPPVEILSTDRLPQYLPTRDGDLAPTRLSCDRSWGQDRVNQKPNPLDCNFDQIGYGAGVHVGLIDTGIDDENDDFSGRMGMCETAIVNPPDAFGCRDDHGHGTHVAGTMAGEYWGLAKESTIHSCRALQNGSGADWQVVLCIDKHILNFRQIEQETGQAPRYIVNESIGGSFSDPMDRANCRMIAAGIMNVVAAGNEDNSLCHFSPARVLQAVTVGATTYDDSRTYFSANDGDAPLCAGGLDLWAPGWNVVSDKRGGCSPNNCPWMSGTSMASPHVAGAAAVFWGLHPDFDQDQVIGAMKAAATPAVTDSRSQSNLLINVGAD